MLLSFVVPCYNEEDNVALFYSEAVRVVREKTDDFELIFINDGSKDGTLKKLKEIAAASDACVKVVNFFSFVGFNTHFMPYDVQQRANGTSKWSFWKLFQYAVEGIVSFSTAPLRLTTVLGLIFSGISFLYLLVVVLQKLIIGIEIAGYPTLVALILLLGGIQLLALGIIGEYLARNYVETKRRPVYIVRDVIESEKEKSVS